MPIIHIAAALVRNSRHQILLVRKKGTTAFMQPGGKIDAGESSLDTLRRELKEELGMRIATAQCRFLKQIEAPAVHEPDHIVRAELFALRWDEPVKALAEIEEARWTSLAEASSLPLAPLTRDEVLPLCCWDT